MLAVLLKVKFGKSIVGDRGKKINAKDNRSSGENLILVTINRDDNRRNLVEITSTYQQRR
jgi:hypothetical protein